jgi:hypothetical protein
MNEGRPGHKAAASVDRRIPDLRRLAGVLLVLIGAFFAWPPAALAQAANDDKLVLGGEYLLASGETLQGHLTIMGGSAVLAPGSRVGQDVAVFGGELHVAGVVAGGLTVFGGSVTLADSAVIRGDLAAFGGALTQEPGAVVQGEAFASPRGLLPQMPRPFPLPEIFPADAGATSGSDAAGLSLLPRILRWQAVTLALSLTLALLAAGLVALLPRRVGTVVAVSARRPLYSAGVGLLTLVLGLLAGGLLLIACGLGLLVWLGLFVALLFGWTAAGTWLGHRLLAWLRVSTPSALAEALVGVFLLTFLARLPFGIGFLVGLAGVSVGLGAVVLTRFGQRSRLSSLSLTHGEAN